MHRGAPPVRLRAPAADAMDETTIEWKAGDLSTRSWPARYCRRHIIGNGRDTPDRRVVIEAC